MDIASVINLLSADSTENRHRDIVTSNNIVDLSENSLITLDPVETQQSVSFTDTEETEDPLIVENELKEDEYQTVSGRRIIDLNYILHQLQEKARHNGLFDCTIEDRGASGAILSHWRAVLTELVATALLVLLGVASCMPVLVENVGRANVIVHPPLEHPALAFGFVVLALAQVFGEVSGAHMNPAITLASTLLGRTPIVLAVAYVLAQCVGGILGFAALQALTPDEILTRVPTFGVTLPGHGISPVAAAGVEAIITGLLTLLACGLWTQKTHDSTGPIKFGLVVAGLVYAGGIVSGASLNPARSFGPALLMGQWQSHWVYWVGPLVGAALFALLHRWVLNPQAYAPPPPTREELPLNDKINC